MSNSPNTSKNFGQLTEQETKEAKKKWSLIDTNGDGVATWEDFLNYKKEKKRNQKLTTAIHTTKKELDKVGTFIKAKSKNIGANLTPPTAPKSVHFQSTAVVKVTDSSETNGFKWKEFQYRSTPDGSMLKCFDKGNEMTSYNIDFSKMKSEEDVSPTNLKEAKNKFCWQITSLNLVFACSDQAGRDRWMGLVKKFFKSARKSETKAGKSLSTVGNTEKRVKMQPVKEEVKKPTDPKLLAELKSLDPFAAGLTEDEKTTIWARIETIQSQIGNDYASSDDIDTESLHTTEEEEEESFEFSSTTSEEDPNVKQTKMGTIRKRAKKVSKKSGQKARSISKGLSNSVKKSKSVKSSPAKPADKQPAKSPRAPPKKPLKKTLDSSGSDDCV